MSDQIWSIKGMLNLPTQQVWKNLRMCSLLPQLPVSFSWTNLSFSVFVGSNVSKSFDIICLEKCLRYPHDCLGYPPFSWWNLLPKFPGISSSLRRIFRHVPAELKEEIEIVEAFSHESRWHNEDHPWNGITHNRKCWIYAYIYIYIIIYIYTNDYYMHIYICIYLCIYVNTCVYIYV